MFHKKSLFFVAFLVILSSLSRCDLLPTNPEDPTETASLFVLNGLGQDVSRIDLSTDSVTYGFVQARDIPGDLDIHKEHLLVLNSTPASLDIFSVKDGSSVKTVNLTAGSNPIELLVDDDRLYISGFVSDQLYILDATDYTLLDSVGVGVDPMGIAVDEQHIYVACSGDWQTGYSGSALHIIAKADYTPVDTVMTSTNPHALARTSGGKMHLLCTGNYFDSFGKVDVIDPATFQVETTIDIGGFPGNILITPGERAYLSDFGQSTESDSAGYLHSYKVADYSVLHDSDNPIKVGYGAGGMLYDDAKELLYVAGFKENTIQALDPSTYEVVQTYEVGDGPQDIVMWREE